MHNLPHSPRSIAILGGGAAGMSCALWLKHLGYSPVIIEQGAELGGQLLKIDRVNRWVLGIPGRTGRELAGIYSRHVLDEAIEARCGLWPLSVVVDGSGFSLILREGENRTASLRTRALVIATGLRVKTREIIESIPGAELPYESGLLSFFPLDHLDPSEAIEGKRVAVIGGGDNAHFTARDLAYRAAVTHLIIRSRPTAQKGIREEIEALIGQGRVREHCGTIIGKLHLRGGVMEIALTGQDGGAYSIEVDRIYARTGFAPNTEFLAELGPLAGLVKTGDNYLIVDSRKRTSLPFVYAIGDVANPDHPSVVAAIADGAVAARAIAHDLGAEP